MSNVTLNTINSDASTKNIETNYTKHKPSPINSAEQTIQNKTDETKNISSKKLAKIIDKINENVSMLNKNIKFSYNDAIKSLTVKVIDASTGKLIREIPPKEVINLQKKLSEIVGIIFDSKEMK